MSGLLQLSTNVQGGRGPMEWATPSTVPSPLHLRNSALDDAQGHVHMLQRVTTALFGTMNIHGKTDIQGCCMLAPCAHRTSMDPQLPTSIVSTATYGELHPDSSQVPICLKNLNACPIVIPTKVIIVKVALANQVPPVTLPMGTSGESVCGPQKW